VSRTNGWKIAYSPNMPTSMSGTKGNWYFDFPSRNGVHYVYKPAPPIKVGQSITMHFAITGVDTAHFIRRKAPQPHGCGCSCNSVGDTLTAQEPYKRWWSVPYIELREGESTLSVAVSPDQWTSVRAGGR
jgi:hypothetical protein